MQKLLNKSFADKKRRLYPHHDFGGKVMIPHIRNGIAVLELNKILIETHRTLTLDDKIFYHKIMLHLHKHLKEIE